MFQGINFHGGHKYGLVEDCEISFTGDDLYAHWPQSTFRPGFEKKHDPRDCSDHLIFRNNIGRYPRFGTTSSTYCGTDCSSHANPCFSLWSSGSNMAILDNHCEEADGPVGMHESYTNTKNIQAWCGPIAVDGNTYSNPGYCASKHCQPNGDDRICYSAGSWPKDGTLGSDPGCDDCGRNLPGCNKTAPLPSGFRDKLWQGGPRVAFPSTVLKGDDHVAPPSFTVSSPGVLLSSDAMAKAGYAGRADASLYAIKRESGYTFFVNSGPPGFAGPLGGPVQSVFTDGGSGRLEAVKSQNAFVIENYQCPEGFGPPCLLDGHPPKTPPRLNKRCTNEPSQRWQFNLTAEWTNVRSSVGGICMHGATGDGFHTLPTEQPACFAAHTVLGTVRGADLSSCGPTDPEIDPASCNENAWSFRRKSGGQGTLQSALVGRTSATAGSAQCLQVASDNSTLVIDDCRGTRRELFELSADGSIESALGGCLDIAPEHVVNAFGGNDTAHVGHWVSNVYDAGDDGILVFVHLELHADTEPAGAPPYFRQGLAHSADGGRTFQWCGHIAQPAISFEHTMHGTKYGRPSWPTNMGLTNYIEKDGYFWIYYSDTNELVREGGHWKVENMSSQVGSAGNPDQGIAVVRAKISEVVAAAKQHKVVPFTKYYSGGWDEPAFVDGYGTSGGRFTPLNLPSQGYTHGDAAYVPAIKQWCIVTASGGRVQDTEQWMRSILIAFTPDGLTFSPWQRVWSDGLDGQNRTWQVCPACSLLPRLTCSGFFARCCVPCSPAVPRRGM